MVRDQALLRQLPSQFNCFVSNQNESLELFSLISLPCSLREDRLRKFNSKDFMSDERKKEDKLIKYSVSQKKQLDAIEKKRKWHHMVTKSRFRARNGDEDEGESSIYSTEV